MDSDESVEFCDSSEDYVPSQNESDTSESQGKSGSENES